MDLVVTNLETLLAAVEAQPEELFDLSRYMRKNSCGTLFCTAGLATTLPHFQAQGFSYGKWDGKGMDVVLIGEQPVFLRSVSDPLFGPDAFDNLFEPAGLGERDLELGYDEGYESEPQVAPNMTDKELAIARLKMQIAKIKGE